ncbi:MAG TPA: hypothetical protein VIY55_09675 [Acetobacteraceae bacterium]
MAPIQFTQQCILGQYLRHHRRLAFFQQHGITGLPILLIPKSAAIRVVHARGIPTSLIIDRKGREVARLEGSADRSTPMAAQLVKRLASDRGSQRLPRRWAVRS